VLLETLHTAEAAGGNVLVIRTDVDDATVLDVDLEPTERLADSAETVFGRFDGGRL